MDQLQNTSANILSLADRCVKCGLCLPQCPTYQLSNNENESPRGRIALIQGWLGGQLAPTTTLTNHLEQCLLCRRCERICPSVVPYGEIIDQAKHLLNERSQPGFSLRNFLTKAGLASLLNKPLLHAFFWSLRLLQKSGVIYLTNKTGLFKLIGLQSAVTFLPPLDNPLRLKTFYPATHKHRRGNIALFTGCISNQLDQKTVIASITLLNRLGYGVQVPEQQVCCGALHLHEGDTDKATKLADENIRTFNREKNITAVVSLVNGCTSQLREYSKLEITDNFNARVKDIIEFLAEIEWPEDVKFKPINKRVALHIPCSLQNVLRAEDKLITLLEKIPGIKLPPEAIYNRCCGAAGSYFLRFPQIARQLQHSALTKLKQNTPDFILSSNIGCALQLKAGLTQEKNTIAVIHPVLLLQQQLTSR